MELVRRRKHRVVRRRRHSARRSDSSHSARCSFFVIRVLTKFNEGPSGFHEGRRHPARRSASAPRGHTLRVLQPFTERQGQNLAVTVICVPESGRDCLIWSQNLTVTVLYGARRTAKAPRGPETTPSRAQVTFRAIQRAAPLCFD